MHTVLKKSEECTREKKYYNNYLDKIFFEAEIKPT